MGRHVQVAIIGSGFAGLGMACELKRRGNDDFVVFERADKVGGTWRDNTYPGCACDIRSDLYSLSFAPNPDWSSRYAAQPEIQAYLQWIVGAFRLDPHIRFRHELEQAKWNSDRGCWGLRTSGGDYTATIAALRPPG